MIKNKKILAIIPARGGSKGLPRKNIRELAGKPLIVWTIKEAKKSKYIDRLILSSEDEEIIRIAKKQGCGTAFIRPTELAQDITPGIDPVIHALQAIPEKYDYVVLLQVTSPLRTVNDIDHCIEYFIQGSAPSCVSVAESKESPYWMYSLTSDNKIKPLFAKNKKIIARRQDLPKVYILNGAIYCAEVNWLLKNKTFFNKKTVAYIMPEERSVDIDNEIDLKLADLLIKDKRRI